MQFLSISTLEKKKFLQNELILDVKSYLAYCCQYLTLLTTSSYFQSIIIMATNTCIGCQVWAYMDAFLMHRYTKISINALGNFPKSLI